MKSISRSEFRVICGMENGEGCRFSESVRRPPIAAVGGVRQAEGSEFHFPHYRVDPERACVL